MKGPAVWLRTGLAMLFCVLGRSSALGADVLSAVTIHFDVLEDGDDKEDQGSFKITLEAGGKPVELARKWGLGEHWPDGADHDITVNGLEKHKIAVKGPIKLIYEIDSGKRIDVDGEAYFKLVDSSNREYMSVKKTLHFADGTTKRDISDTFPK